MDAVVTKLEKEKVSLTDQIDKMSDQLAEVSNLKALEERELENKEALQVLSLDYVIMTHLGKYPPVQRRTYRAEKCHS